MIAELAIATGLLATFDDLNDIDYDELFQRAILLQNPEILLGALNEEQRKKLYQVLCQWVIESKNEKEKKVRLKRSTLFMKVEAVLRTDNGAYRQTFNAVPYLIQAPKDPALRDLEDCSFCGNYAADDVAWWTRDWDPKIKKIMDQIELQELGFEVTINEDQARSWLDAARPGWSR